MAGVLSRSDGSRAKVVIGISCRIELLAPNLVQLEDHDGDETVPQ
jgi:hypothetical protein